MGMEGGRKIAIEAERESIERACARRHEMHKEGREGEGADE